MGLDIVKSADSADEAGKAGAPDLACEIAGVGGGDSGFPVQLVRENGRLAVRAINEGGFACTDIDLLDLVDWLHRLCPQGVNADAVTSALSVLAARSCSK
jgi:hypothetical protein